MESIKYGKIIGVKSQKEIAQWMSAARLICPTFAY